MKARSAFDGDTRIMLCESMQRFAREDHRTTPGDGNEDATNRARQCMAVDRCAGMARPRAAAERGRLWRVHRRSRVVAERRRGSTVAPASGGMPGRSVRSAAGGTADARAGRAARQHRGRRSSRADGGLASGSRQCRAERSRERWNLCVSPDERSACALPTCAHIFSSKRETQPMASAGSI